MPRRLLDCCISGLFTTVPFGLSGKLLVQKLKPFKSTAGMFALSLLITMGQCSFGLPAFADITDSHFQLPVNGSLSDSGSDGSPST